MHTVIGRLGGGRLCGGTENGCRHPPAQCQSGLRSDKGPSRGPPGARVWSGIIRGIVFSLSGMAALILDPGHDPRIEQLKTWVAGLGTAWSIDPDSCAPASADASFRRYFRVRTGHPAHPTAIVMDAPPAHEDCRPFIHVAKLFGDAGVTVPTVLAQDLAQGFLLLADLGSQTYLSRLDEPSARQLYADAAAALVQIQSATRPGELLCNCTRIIGADGRELNPLLVRDFTEAEIEGRKQVREYARFFRDNLAGCEASFVNDTGVQVGVRQTRQALGTHLLRNEDILAGKKFRDGIAQSPWPIELHAGAKPKVEWLIDDVYEIPFGCFVPQRGEGLLTAGRCLSAEHEAVASARFTAQCFSYGHAIGCAAAISALDGVAPRMIDGTDIRAELNREGAQLE